MAPCASLVCLCRAALAFVSSSAMTLKGQHECKCLFSSIYVFCYTIIYAEMPTRDASLYKVSLVLKIRGDQLVGPLRIFFHLLYLFHTCWLGTCSSKHHTVYSFAPVAPWCVPDCGPEPHSLESTGFSPWPDAQSGTEGHRPQTPPVVSLAHGSPGKQN